MRLLYLFFICSLFSLELSGQCTNNPSLQAGDINPAPLTAGQNGTLSFNFSENLSDYTDDENDPVKILVCLLNIAPVNGVNSVGGTYADHFNWQYDASLNCFLGTQNQDILGGTGGTITVNFTQINPVACPNNQMGFNANIQPAACMNEFNQVSDDSESSFTCTLQSVDTDGDGLTDVEETTGVDDPNTPANTNGNISDPNNICDPLGLVTTDTDNDGLTDCEETTGMDDPSTTSNPNGYMSDPTLSDTDGDGLNDGEEGLNASNPNDTDSDDDGLSDGAEDLNGNGVVDAGESDPSNPDTDSDGINDGTEKGIVAPAGDPDGTGPLMGTDTGSPNYVVDADPSTTTDPFNPDSDGDGVLDGIEDTNNDGQVAISETDPNSPCNYNRLEVTEIPSAAWNAGDCDLDGLNNGEEVTGIDDLATTAVQPNSTPSDPNNICDPLQLDSSCGSTACVNITTYVWLEGGYDNGSMHTKLNDLGYLPGQDPSTFFGGETPAGQPYAAAPWNYAGTEGNAMNYTTVGNAKAGYSATVVDWVLVSLRTGTDRATTVCTRAALLHADGHIEFIAGSNCCNIDITQNYYLVIEHHNHLIVMSHEQLPVVGNTITYDFRIQESYKELLGYGQKQVASGVYTMFAGNGDQASGSNGNKVLNIISSDKDKWLEENGEHSSYYFNDFDLNGDVNVQDKNLYLENNGKFSDVKWEN